MLLAAANAWQPIADALYSTPQAWRVSTSWRLWPFTPLTPALSSPLRGVAMKRELTTEDEKVGRSVPAEPPPLVPAPCLRLARDGSPYHFHSRGKGPGSSGGAVTHLHARVFVAKEYMGSKNAEMRCRIATRAQRAPSPLNGERAGVRGVAAQGVPRNGVVAGLPGFPGFPGFRGAAKASRHRLAHRVA